MAEPLPPANPHRIIKQNSNKPSNLSGENRGARSVEKRNLSIGEEAAISQLARLFAMPGLAGDALRLLVALVRTASATNDQDVYLLFLAATAEARSRKLRTP